MTDRAGPILVLLRGINVGGRALVPMAGLRSALSEEGLTGVRTHLQSGNVLADSGSETAETLGRRVESVIEDRFGVTVRAITRTAADLADLERRNPFLGSGSPGSGVHTVFLAAAPDPRRIGDLDPDRSPRDRFQLSGREIFVHYPQGSGRSKLDLDYFERKLAVAGTARNWNTVSALLGMVGV